MARPRAVVSSTRSRVRRRSGAGAAALVLAGAFAVGSAQAVPPERPAQVAPSASAGDGEALAAADWRNATYTVPCGAAGPEPLTLSGGRWADPAAHDPATGSFRTLMFEGALVVPGHPDVVLARLTCIAGGASAALSSTSLVFLRVAADGTPEQLAAVTVPPTGDITVGSDGTVVVGHHTFLGDEPQCCPEGYVTVTITWVDGVPVAQPEEAVAPPADEARAPALGGLDDPLAGLAVATPAAGSAGATDTPAAAFACVGVELAPGYGDPVTNGLLQAALEQRGFPTGTDRGDGEFGTATQAALAAWVEANRAALASFTVGDDTVIEQASTSGVVRRPLLDALGIGCASGVLPLEALIADGETSV